MAKGTSVVICDRVGEVETITEKWYRYVGESRVNGFDAGLEINCSVKATIFRAASTIAFPWTEMSGKLEDCAVSWLNDGLRPARSRTGMTQLDWIDGLLPPAESTNAHTGGYPRSESPARQICLH